MKRKKKKEKKGKEGGLVSSWRPLNSLSQAFAKKFSRALKRGNRRFKGTTWDFLCAHRNTQFLSSNLNFIN